MFERAPVAERILQPDLHRIVRIGQGWLGIENQPVAAGNAPIPGHRILIAILDSQGTIGQIQAAGCFQKVDCHRGRRCIHEAVGGWRDPGHRRRHRIHHNVHPHGCTAVAGFILQPDFQAVVSLIQRQVLRPVPTADVCSQNIVNPQVGFGLPRAGQGNDGIVAAV